MCSRRDGPVSIDADFFEGLGGDSLLAAEFTTRLREDPGTARVTVRDVYESPTVRQLAGNCRAPRPRRRARDARHGRPCRDSGGTGGRPSTIELLLVTLAQGLWLLLMLLLVCGAGALIVAAGLPIVRALTIVELILLTPVLAVAGLAGTPSFRSRLP
jgi:hypothetical protein